ncbi:antigen 5 like allergen Cul n 1-like isoform X2 [Armigeres subalbatus]|uniref:antigen 5 like allergen Cul n 1-like isoform X2 n=1 Tax=Armigeres subalbatus TaxID=124917 RepID=UPI002ED38AC3
MRLFSFNIICHTKRKEILPHFITAIVISLFFTSILSQSANYCDRSLCPFRVLHIGCHGLTDLASACGARAIEVFMDISKKALITDHHNRLRNRVALGNQNFTKTSSYPQAARMTTMVFTFNARRCVNGRDRCRNTESMKAVGQSIASQRHCMDISDEEVILNWIDAWFREYTDSNLSHIESYPAKWDGPAIDHFAQIVSDRSSRIGCAMVSRIELLGMKKLFVCNYSVMNTAGQPVYAMGPTGSKCKMGINEDYAGLCNPLEIYV